MADPVEGRDLHDELRILGQDAVRDQRSFPAPWITATQRVATPPVPLRDGPFTPTTARGWSLLLATLLAISALRVDGGIKVALLLVVATPVVVAFVFYVITRVSSFRLELFMHREMLHAELERIQRERYEAETSSSDQGDISTSVRRSQLDR